MRNLRPGTLLTLLLVLLLGGAGCSSGWESAPVPVSIAVTPVSPSIPQNATLAFTATGTFPDGTAQDLTGSVVWSAGDSLATISNAPGSRGVATGVAPGSTTITATFDGVSGSTGLTVTAAPAVSLAAQSGTLTSGTAGNATFAVTTARIADGVDGTVTWYADASGTTEGAAPAGITPTVAGVASDASTVTMAIDPSAAAGAYYFKVTFGATASSLATLTVGQPVPTVSLSAQSGTLASGTGGTATFTATTANIADGASGFLSWYSSSAGTTAGTAPNGITIVGTGLVSGGATITISAGPSIAAGTYYFKATFGSVASPVATLVVD
ncbi:MAG: Ig-like domain-containing protein [Holophaga sp.]|nr:Ig-like domain-containing protein [Holophaga sp.]